MYLNPNALNVTTGLIAAAACWVIFTLLKRPVDSNLPPLYFAALVIYSNGVVTRLAPGLIYGGLVLSLLIRFEFLSNVFLQILKTLEILVLTVIVYECTTYLMNW